MICHYCCDCAQFQRGGIHTEEERCRVPTHMDAVTGRPHTLTCRERRNSACDPCGIGGKLWAPRLLPWWRVLWFMVTRR